MTLIFGLKLFLTFVSQRDTLPFVGTATGFFFFSAFCPQQPGSGSGFESSSI